jgi:hypothetical protein
LVRVALRRSLEQDALASHRSKHDLRRYARCVEIVDGSEQHCNSLACLASTRRVGDDFRKLTRGRVKICRHGRILHILMMIDGWIMRAELLRMLRKCTESRSRLRQSSRYRLVGTDEVACECLVWCKSSIALSLSRSCGLMIIWMRKNSVT